MISNNFPFHIRKATADDASFLALALIEALGGNIMKRYEENSLSEDDRKRLTRIEHSVRTDGTLYNWRQATIVTTNEGIPVGASIAYPGKGYHERRVFTFSLLRDLIHFDTEKMEDETQDGEHYLDTLAVLPKWRKKGIATTLLQAWITEAKHLRLTPTLTCAKDNERARRRYEAQGLRVDGKLFIFGEEYLRMTNRETEKEQ